MVVYVFRAKYSSETTGTMKLLKLLMYWKNIEYCDMDLEESSDTAINVEDESLGQAFDESTIVYITMLLVLLLMKKRYKWLNSLIW